MYRAQVISLGIHVIEVGPEMYRMLLMEVMPSVLARRTFPPPRTAAQLEPGFRDAPDPAHHLAILFMKVPAFDCSRNRTSGVRVGCIEQRGLVCGGGAGGALHDGRAGNLPYYVADNLSK